MDKYREYLKKGDTEGNEVDKDERQKERNNK